MQIPSSFFLACFALCIYCGASSRANIRYERPYASMRSRIQLHQTPFLYLSDTTAPFFIDGTALPDVELDIEESYSGTLPVDDTGKELFFWFVPSKNPSARNEIVIWLNGGPGCSSLYGFFHEQGPISWPLGSYSPVENVWSWDRLTSMVWIDQPVGTGYSRGTPNATSSEDAALQFLAFWKNFIDLFSLHNKKVYITGESYAGQYVPYIADAMLSKQDMVYFKVCGIMLFDPSFGWPLVSKQVPAVAFVDYNHDSFPFNETFSVHIHNMSEICGYTSVLSEGLNFPPRGILSSPTGLNTKGVMLDSCDVYGEILQAIGEVNPCFNIYKVSQLCPVPWDVLEFPSTLYDLPTRLKTAYFNRTDVKKLIHVPLNTEWMVCSEEPVFLNDTDLSLPSALTGGPLHRVIEATSNVIVAHSLLDMVLLLNGTLLTLQNLTGNGVQGFTTPPIQPFIVPRVESPFSVPTTIEMEVLGGWVMERDLTFSSVVLSGHEIPMYQPSAAFRQMELLLGRISNLSDISPFSIQPPVQFSI